jgi:hypothetical protein
MRVDRRCGCMTNGSGKLRIRTHGTRFRRRMQRASDRRDIWRSFDCLIIRRWRVVCQSIGRSVHAWITGGGVGSSRGYRWSGFCLGTHRRRMTRRMGRRGSSGIVVGRVCAASTSVSFRSLSLLFFLLKLQGHGEIGIMLFLLFLRRQWRA